MHFYSILPRNKLITIFKGIKRNAKQLEFPKLYTMRKNKKYLIGLDVDVKQECWKE